MEDCELVNATATAQVISLSVSLYFVSFFCPSRMAVSVSLHFFFYFYSVMHVCSHSRAWVCYYLMTKQNKSAVQTSVEVVEHIIVSCTRYNRACVVSWAPLLVLTNRQYFLAFVHVYMSLLKNKNLVLMMRIQKHRMNGKPKYQHQYTTQLQLAKQSIFPQDCVYVDVWFWWWMM